jgi:hypothetical protein
VGALLTSREQHMAEREQERAAAAPLRAFAKNTAPTSRLAHSITEPKSGPPRNRLKIAVFQPSPYKRHLLFFSVSAPLESEAREICTSTTTGRYSAGNKIFMPAMGIRGEGYGVESIVRVSVLTWHTYKPTPGRRAQSEALGPGPEGCFSQQGWRRESKIVEVV